MAVDHLSLYQLTIEDGTRFADLYRLGKLAMPPDDAAAAMYEVTQEVCGAAGLPRYGDYVGVGPGAHGRLTLDGSRVATETMLAPDQWLNAAEQDGTGIAAQSA